MANQVTNLGYSTNLQIVIVPSGKSYTTPQDPTGLLIFREGSNIIEVRGHEYKATSAADLTAITDALKNTGYLTESGGVLTAQNPGTVAALLGTKITTTSGEGVNTVSGWIDSLLGSISTINTNISNLQTATATDGTGNFVVRDKTVGEGHTDFSTTTAIQTAINNAKTAAEQTAASDATTKVNTAKSDLIGGGTDSDDSTKTALDTDLVDDGDTWAVSEANLKTLSHLKDLILNLQGQINTLSGSDLSNIQDAIDAIEQELIDGQGTGLTTIIDGLKLFLGSGLGTTGATYNVNNGTQTTLAGIISALESEIAAADAKHSVVTDGVEGNASAGTTNYAVVTSSTDGTTGQTTYTVQTTATLDTALSNAKTTITEVSGTDGSTNYVKVTKTAGSGATADSYAISSTATLDTALSNAKTVVTGGSGTASQNNYIAVAKTTNGNDSYAVSTTTALDTAISGAQSAAEATALSYAQNVVSWTVID